MSTSFDWWYGEVEDTNDPMKMGRCKVRVFGRHTDNKELLPTSSLPWATLTNSPNTPHSTGTPLEGDWVFGFFADGSNSQSPVIIGVFSSITSNTTTITANTSSTNAIKTDVPNGQKGIRTPGQPTTSRLSRSLVDGTNISFTNSNLVHACDFKFRLGFDLDFGLAGLVNPATALTKAIKRGKNNAANIIRAAMTKINEAIRAVLKGILFAFSLDTSGVLSAHYSFAKETVRKINYWTKKVAQYVEDVATIYYFVQDLQQLLGYLQSLPKKYLAMAKECILTFSNQVKNTVSQLQSLPTAALKQVEAQVSGLKVIAQQTATLVSNATSNQNIPANIITIVNNPNKDSANSLTAYFATQANSNTVMALNSSNSFDKANTKAP